jgi:thiol:disulfide interchange protein DsbD
MEQSVFPRPDVTRQLKRFVTVALYTDLLPIGSITHDQRLDLASANLEREVDLVAQTTSPYYVVLTPDGKVIASAGADTGTEGFREFLKNAYEKFEKETAAKVASTD